MLESNIPSFLFLFGYVCVSFFPLIARCSDQRVSLCLFPRPALRIQTGPLHEPRRDAERVTQPRVLLLLRFCYSVRLTYAANRKYSSNMADATTLHLFYLNYANTRVLLKLHRRTNIYLIST